MAGKNVSRERFIIKIIVLGSSNVGKTSLLTRSHRLLTLCVFFSKMIIFEE